MAESGPIPGQSTKVSFMDLAMRMCAGAEGGRALNSKCSKSTAAVFLAQFSASLGFVRLYRLVERGCYRVIALYKEVIECSLEYCEKDKKCYNN